MVYGSRSRYRKSSSSTSGRRFGRISVTRAGYIKAKKTRVTRTRVARRLNRKEVKYDDDYYNLNAWDKYTQATSGTAGTFANFVLGGVVKNEMDFISRVSGGAGFASVSGPVGVMAPNCLSNIDSGTTASTRIGNMVQPKYITLKCVLNAAATNNAEDPETLGKFEDVTGTPSAIARFMRTSVKIMIIRDKSMNEKGFVSFSDVFEEPTQTAGPTAVNNPFLWNRKLNTIGRYEILKQVEYQLDADDPQKSFTWVVPLKGIPIRFNGAANEIGTRIAGGLTGTGTSSGITPNPTNFTSYVGFTKSSESQSMTNGIYILAVAHCGLNAGGAGAIISPSIVFSSRLSFEDN